MIRVAVCDDDWSFAKTVISKIRSFCLMELPDNIVYETAPVFSSAKRVIQYLEEGKQINILFLDIDMPDMNGFELAWQLNRISPDIIIIFVSAYDNFVYNSFDYNPFRFLRKSHLNEEFTSALKKAIDKCLYAEKSLSFDTVDGEQVLRVKDVIYFESDRNYYVIHHVGGIHYKCRGTLSDVESKMNEYGFYRIHNAIVVNMDHIEVIRSSTELVVTGGERVAISLKRFPEFKKEYMKFSRRRLD